MIWVYHHNDLDGRCAAAVANNRSGHLHEWHPDLINAARSILTQAGFATLIHQIGSLRKKENNA